MEYRNFVSEMTYNVSMGTLNHTIPYHTVTSSLLRVFQFKSCTRKQEYYARYASINHKYGAKILLFIGFPQISGDPVAEFSAAIE